MVAGGALVGYGTSRGSGCTSGHGVCGLSRASKRSAAAVASFMTSAFVTATTVDALPALRRLFRTDKWMLNSALHPELGEGGDKNGEELHHNVTAAEAILSSTEHITSSEADALSAIIAAQDVSALATQLPYFPAAVTVGALGVMFWIKSAVERSSVPCEDRQTALAAAQGSGLLFAGGLAVSGMSNPTKVLSFVTLPTGLEGAVTAWDPSLPWVMGGAICMALPFFQLVPRRLALPACSPAWRLPTATEIDSPLVRGSLIFGAGWGLAGLCPGPGVMLATTGAVAPLAWMAAMLAGMRLEMWMNAPKATGGVAPPSLPALPEQPHHGLPPPDKQPQSTSGGGAEREQGGVQAKP